MADQRMRVADLDEAKLARLRAMEDEIGTCIVALEPPSTFAELEPPKLQRLQELERELGLVLLAYRPASG